MRPAEGESGYNWCSAWEFIGRELIASWGSQGSKLLANDIAVSAARQVLASTDQQMWVVSKCLQPLADVSVLLDVLTVVSFCHSYGVPRV